MIARPKTLAQWQSYAGTLSIEIGIDDEALVDALVSPGHPSPAGYSDPAYPLEGRRGG